MNMNIENGLSSSVQGMDFRKSIFKKNTAAKSESDSTNKTSVNNSPKTNNISKSNEEKLSAKAKAYLENLRKEYGDYDIKLGNSDEEISALSKNGSKEYSVIFSNEELERMAEDKEYADSKMKQVDEAVSTLKEKFGGEGYDTLFDELFTENGLINKVSIVIDKDGTMSFFAELEKISEKQRERIEQMKEKKQEDVNNNPYLKDDSDSVKRTTIEASTLDELVSKIKEVDWSTIIPSKSGDRFNFSV